MRSGCTFHAVQPELEHRFDDAGLEDVRAEDPRSHWSVRLVQRACNERSREFRKRSGMRELDRDEGSPRQTEQTEGRLGVRAVRHELKHLGCLSIDEERACSPQ